MHGRGLATLPEPSAPRQIGTRDGIRLSQASYSIRIVPPPSSPLREPTRSTDGPPRIVPVPTLPLPVRIA